MPDMKIWKIAAVSGLCLMLGGCALLPAEEEYGMVPIAKQYQAAEYQLAYVTRGDIEKTQKVGFTYVPVSSEDLSFQVSGIKIDKIYVMEGQSVEAGQLLAELDMGTLETDIAAKQSEISMARLQRAHRQENEMLYQERARLECAGDSQRLQEQMENLEEAYRKDMRDFEDRLYLLALQLEDLISQKDRRQIVAKESGVITYARKVQEGDISSKDSRIFTLVSSTLSIFKADTALWNAFQPGDRFEITVNKKTYPATCVDPVETLGIEPEEKVEGDFACVYLVLDDPAAEVSDGDRGTLTLVLDSRKDVLRLPNNTVHEAQGKRLIYFVEENGLRSYRFVETGLEGDEWIEIVSGVQEGDNVIVK